VSRRRAKYFNFSKCFEIKQLIKSKLKPTHIMISDDSNEVEVVLLTEEQFDSSFVALCIYGNFSESSQFWGISENNHLLG
jgi:hypothetical protein